MVHKWTKNGPVDIDPTKYIKGTGTKKYVKSRQCAAMFTKGRRAGLRCSWYARENSEYCVRHSGAAGTTRSPEHLAAIARGRSNWWARIRALNEKHPGLMRQLLNVDGAKAARAARKALEKTTMPKPKTDDPVILKAHKAVVTQVANLPAIPDKPFDELEPHEQLVAITGQSLRVVHEILGFKLTDEQGVPQLKVASMVKDTALRALSVRVKVDRNALTARRIDKMSELLDRLKNGDDAKVIEG